MAHRSDFSEDELIAAVRRLLSDETPGVRQGIGDDAALVELGAHLTVLTTDLLVEDVHFRTSQIGARDLGAKALAVNVSDVAAMGGSPRFGLISLGLPAGTDMAWVVELYGGLRDAATDYGMTLVGGDTSLAANVVISVTVVGEVAKNGAVLRSGARPGDRVVVTGALGASGGGLWLAGRDPHDVGPALASDWGRELVAAHVRPVARVGEGQTLAQAGATAMMDISDGLAIDLARLCQESEVGAAIALDAVPIAEGLQALQAAGGPDALELALSGGEDYELLATIAPGAVHRAEGKLRERFGTALTDVGEIRKERGLLAVGSDGTEKPLEPRGWDHFAH
jgi:thiamine-monophosphate kinase